MSRNIKAGEEIRCTTGNRKRSFFALIINTLIQKKKVLFRSFYNDASLRTITSGWMKQQQLRFFFTNNVYTYIYVFVCITCINYNYFYICIDYNNNFYIVNIYVGGKKTDDFILMLTYKNSDIW